MIEWLKKYSAVIGILTTVLGALSAAGAYADSLIDQRVNIRVTELVKKDDLGALARQLNGVQEQVNNGTSDNRVIKEQLQNIQKQQDDRTRSIEKQLELIIKLIERGQ